MAYTPKFKGAAARDAPKTRSKTQAGAGAAKTGRTSKKTTGKVRKGRIQKTRKTAGKLIMEKGKRKLKEQAKRQIKKKLTDMLNRRLKGKGLLLGGSVCPMDVGTGPKGGTCGRSGPHCRFNC